MIAELTGLCRNVVTLERRTGVDGYGEPTYGAAVAYRARVSGRVRTVRSFAGEEVVSTHAVYFAGAPAVGPHDRLTLSTGDVNSTETGAVTPVIFNIGRFPDEQGRPALTVYLA